MAKNSSMIKASKAKEDEFYTQLSDIERELKHYRDALRGKTIFCNCDDPETSNFWNYFRLNFYYLGIKRVISTHYEADKPSYKLEIVSNGDGEQIGLPDYVKTPLKENGDFRSPECIEILQEADIVITNPPFSLFREYVAQLMEYKKDFLIIGNQNAVTYKEIFPLIQRNLLWLGYYCGDMEFTVPDYYEPRATRYREENGIKYRSMGNICWYTNLDISKRHEEIPLYKVYRPEEYPQYANYNAIEVSKTSEIPCDYMGEMGVPITFLDKYNPEQFDIIGSSRWLGRPMSEIAEKGTYVSGGIRFYLPIDKEAVGKDNHDRQMQYRVSTTELLSGDVRYHRLYDRIVIRRRRGNNEN